ncbi:MAG: thioredoxin domain-containing protein, partial [Hyphomonadaceae bacterium]|nr:thioredoxin domain-containing protein [Hyphomonadaceae bacterium]
MTKLATLLIMVGTLALSSCAESQSPAYSRSDIKDIIREYLLENPEIVREALTELKRREDMAAINAHRDELFNDRRDMVVGPDTAKVTIVEFFDYNCGFCKQSTDWVASVIEKHPEDVRVIFKELPILDGRTNTSRNAARAALAAGRQGRYFDMHLALMAERSLTSERIDQVAEKVGIDVAKMRRDMDDPALDAQIEDALLLM